MIHVERVQVDKTGKAIRPPAAWFQRATAATKIAAGERQNHKAQQATYAHPELRAALERLFLGKCAYCESTLIAGWDWEVDHFRPKGRISDREDHPGYYWLTYVWENLYPSCTHCNQRRKGRPRWDDPTEYPARGKADQFPLLDETYRAMDPAEDIRSERTLLIDPCSEDPEVYLGYDPKGKVFSLARDPRGETTIEVFNLSRHGLNELRLQAIRSVIWAMKLIHEGQSAAATAELDAFLAKLQSQGQQYAGVARYVAAHPAEFDA